MLCKALIISFFCCGLQISAWTWNPDSLVVAVESNPLGFWNNEVEYGYIWNALSSESIKFGTSFVSSSITLAICFYSTWLVSAFSTVISTPRFKLIAPTNLVVILLWRLLSLSTLKTRFFMSFVNFGFFFIKVRKAPPAVLTFFAYAMLSTKIWSSVSAISVKGIPPPVWISIVFANTCRMSSRGTNLTTDLMRYYLGSRSNVANSVANF